MAIAGQSHILKHQERLAKHLSKLNSDGTVKQDDILQIIQAGDNLSSFFAGIGMDGSSSEKELLKVIRSEVRKTWMQHPTKLAFLELGVIKDLDPDTRTIWRIKCQLCGEKCKKTDIEVDHKNGEHTMKTFADIEPFARSILLVKFDDLQRVCKPCHKIKTYAERYKMSFDDAKIELVVVEFGKLKADKQLAKLKSLGITAPKLIKSAATRKGSYRNYLKGEQ